LLFGPDSNQGTGLGTASSSVGTDHSSGDFGIRQAYVALRAPIGNGVDLKVGVFDTIIGYEVFNNGGNPNYTRSYGYSIEPTTHTGVLASYQVTDIVSLSAGIANTTDPTINGRSGSAESYKTYMASVAVTAPDNMGAIAGSTLYAGVINGDATGASGPGSHTTSLYVGASVATPIEGLAVGAAWDYLAAENGGDGTYANATALYASFQATEKLTFHGRGEYFTQTGGQSTGGETLTMLPGKVLALTGTVQYDLWANVISRLEMRWDHQADGTGRAFGGSSGSSDRRNAYLVAANLIYQF
jgi:hypothetical protein